MTIELYLLALGLVMIAFPGMFAGRTDAQHEQRVNALRAGAEESFFEERRTLESYRPRSVQRVRMVGGLIAALACVAVFFRS